MGKFNPSSANRVDFNALFAAWKDGSIVLESDLDGAMGIIAQSLATITGTLTPLNNEVHTARGGYDNLDARLDAMAGGGGSSDYSDLTNKPQINSVTLDGNKSLADLGIAAASDLSAEATARTAADTKQNAALVDVVDSGVKNYAEVADKTNAAGSSYVEIPVKVPAGTWIVSFANVVSTDTDANWCRARFHDAEGNGVSSYFSAARGENHSVEVTTTGESASIRINPSDTIAHSAGDTITVTSAMVVSKAQWDISHEYVPYVPTLQQMWAAIQALQNGGA